MKLNEDKTVELTEAETVLSEWHESLMDHGFSPQSALEKMYWVTDVRSKTWELLNQQDFRDHLATTEGTTVKVEGVLPTVYVLSKEEAETLNALREGTAKILLTAADISEQRSQPPANELRASAGAMHVCVDDIA